MLGNIRTLKTGTSILKVFIILVITDIVLVALFFAKSPDRYLPWIVAAAFLAVIETVIFWTGIIMVYISSVQLGINHRVMGIALGWIPIANILMLGKIVRICSAEIQTETQKAILNESRKQALICRTKYPILLVHGVFFRDSEVLNYWGRIPGELERNGATVFYGQHHSAASVMDCSTELETRILDIVNETGCGKVNIIAHSKGGLDARAAAAKTTAGEHIASITTINTPHWGCEFADYFLDKIPDSVQIKFAGKYNTAAEKLGDTDPDFISAVRDLTASSCQRFNEETPDRPGILYQWVGSVQSRAASGKFPLNFTYGIVKLFDGRNDGLVGERSFAWGEKYAFLDNKENRGISHADMIDLNRENIVDFAVREFYVQLAADLKAKGL